MRATATNIIEEEKPAAGGEHGLDPRTIRAGELQTVEECALLMGAIDKMRDGLTSQIRHAGAMRWKTGKSAPGRWYSDTVSLLNAVSVARNQVQDRRGVIRRERNKAERLLADVRSERRFVEAARRVLPREQYLAIREAADPPNMQMEEKGAARGLPERGTHGDGVMTRPSWGRPGHEDTV